MDTQLQKLAVIGNQSLEHLQAQVPYNPLCKQHQECAGWGANAWTGAPAQFPVAQLSYTNGSTRTWHGMTEPAEAVVNPVTNPTFSGLQDAQAFSSISDFVDYSNANFAGATPPQGSNGIFGNSFSSVFESYFQRPEDKDLSVTSAVRAIVHLSLPPDPVTHGYSLTFDQFFLRAVQSFPPPSVNSDLSIWYTQYEPLFDSYFEKFGTSIVVEASLGGMVELYSSWGTPLLDMGFDKAKLAANALIDFTNATGLGGHTGAIDPVYETYTDVNQVTCVGGDPSKCNKQALQSGAWAESTVTAPRLLRYKLLAQSELLNRMDPDIKKALDDATSMYIHAKQKQWDAVNKCPTSCNDRGNCTKGSDKCDCRVQSCSIGRMCSAIGAAVPSCGGITWGKAGCNDDASGTVKTPMKPGDKVQVKASGCGFQNMISQCQRNSKGQLVAFYKDQIIGGDWNPVTGKPVSSGCSDAIRSGAGTITTCCFPK
jgi:hypothetical protein